MGKLININPSNTTGLRISPAGLGDVTLSGKSPYPKYYDISTGQVWTNTSSWDYLGPGRVNIVLDQALFNDYNGGSGQFVALQVSDGNEIWANTLTSSGYEVVLTADSSIENYYWGDGFGGSNALGKNDSSTLSNIWKKTSPADVLDIKVDKNGNNVYTLEGFGSSNYPVRKWAATDGSLLWISDPLTSGANGMDIDLDEDYVAVGGGYGVSKVLSDGSVNWIWGFPGYTSGVATYRPSIDSNNNVYAATINTNITSRPSYLVKIDGNGNQQWLNEIATEDVSGNYGRRGVSHIAEDGNVWVLGHEAPGVNTPPFRPFMYKYRASDGILMERWELGGSGGRPDYFDVVPGTNEVIVIYSNPDSVKKYNLGA